MSADNDEQLTTMTMPVSDPSLARNRRQDRPPGVAVDRVPRVSRFTGSGLKYLEPVNLLGKKLNLRTLEPLNL